MDFEKQYESRKRQRAETDVPADFADRVMASIHHTRTQMWLNFFQKLGVAAEKSKILRTSVYPIALTLWILRLGALLTFFIPR